MSKHGPPDVQRATRAGDVDSAAEPGARSDVAGSASEAAGRDDAANALAKRLDAFSGARGTTEKERASDEQSAPKQSAPKQGDANGLMAAADGQPRRGMPYGSTGAELAPQVLAAVRAALRETAIGQAQRTGPEIDFDFSLKTPQHAPAPSPVTQEHLEARVAGSSAQGWFGRHLASVRRGLINASSAALTGTLTATAAGIVWLANQQMSPPLPLTFQSINPSPVGRPLQRADIALGPPFVFPAPSVGEAIGARARAEGAGATAQVGAGGAVPVTRTRENKRVSALNAGHAARTKDPENQAPQTAPPALTPPKDSQSDNLSDSLSDFQSDGQTASQMPREGDANSKRRIQRTNRGSNQKRPETLFPPLIVAPDIQPYHADETPRSPAPGATGRVAVPALRAGKSVPAQPLAPVPRPADATATGPNLLSKTPTQAQQLAPLGTALGPKRGEARDTARVRALQLLKAGKSSQARKILRALRADGDGAAAFMLAESFDPARLPLGGDTSETQARLAYAAAIRLAGITSSETSKRLAQGNTLLRDVAKPISIAKARRLFAAGQINKARALLRLVDTPKDADVALALARTFDPRVLAAQSNGETFADTKEAERLYRRWYQAARAAGDVADDVVVERIIRSMQRR